MCCGHSKEPSQWDSSFEHPKHMLKLKGKKLFTILRWFFFIYTYVLNYIFDVSELIFTEKFFI